MSFNRLATAVPSLSRVAKSVLPVVTAFALATGMAVAADQAPAGAAADEAQAAPKLSGLKATVAQGGSIELAASAFTGEELAALRPHYADLKPKIRSNRGD